MLKNPKGSPLSVFFRPCENYFRFFNTKGPPSFFWYLTMDVKKSERVPPFSAPGAASGPRRANSAQLSYCKRILDTFRHCKRILGHYLRSFEKCQYPIQYNFYISQTFILFLWYQNGVNYGENSQYLVVYFLSKEKVNISRTLLSGCFLYGQKVLQCLLSPQFFIIFKMIFNFQNSLYAL